MTCPKIIGSSSPQFPFLSLITRCLTFPHWALLTGMDTKALYLSKIAIYNCQKYHLLKVKNWKLPSSFTVFCIESYLDWNHWRYLWNHFQHASGHLKSVHRGWLKANLSPVIDRCGSWSTVLKLDRKPITFLSFLSSEYVQQAFCTKFNCIAAKHLWLNLDN